MERPEEGNADPIGSRPTGHPNPTLAPTTGLRNPDVTIVLPRPRFPLRCENFGDT